MRVCSAAAAATRVAQYAPRCTICGVWLRNTRVRLTLRAAPHAVVMQPHVRVTARLLSQGCAMGWGMGRGCCRVIAARDRDWGAAGPFASRFGREKQEVLRWSRVGRSCSGYRQYACMHAQTPFSPSPLFPHAHAHAYVRTKAGRRVGANRER